MRGFLSLLAVVLIGGLAAPAKAQTCASIKDIDKPFPLGTKAQLPWDEMDGYWGRYKDTDFYYRIEVVEVYTDDSRSVAITLYDVSGNTILASGVGLVRANAYDFWARVRGLNLDFKIRIQAFYQKSTPSRTALVATIKNNKTNACMDRHILKRFGDLDGGSWLTGRRPVKK